MPLTKSVVLLIAVVWAAFVLLLWIRFKGAYRRLMRVGEFAGAFFAVFCLCSILQLLWILHWKPGPHQQTAAWATTAQPPREHPRLVWIVFDELSLRPGV